MSQKLCCNCLHCARWNTSRGVECHCDIDDRYLGYLGVMNDDNNCKNWEKETKWDIQAKHDAQVRADAIDEILTHTKTIVDEDGIIHEVVLVKDIKKLKEKQSG